MKSVILISTITSIIVPLYVYIGYPLVLFFLTKLIANRKIKYTDNYYPTVSLLVSCYNEAEVVREKIINSLELDYPKGQLEIFFISDGSDDGTDQIIKEFSDHGIQYVRQEGRLGKTMALNMTVPKTKSEFIVFSDANAMYQPDAIKKLIRNFSDPDIGYVVGAALYSDAKDSASAESEETYWQYEMTIKKMESQLHSVVGGDGAIYAIRKELYQEMEQQDINDFVNPLQIIARGYHGFFDSEAICYEETAGDFNKEAKRKQRIVNRSFRGLMRVKEVLNPFKTGFFSFEVISHKLLRWLIPVFLIIIATGSIFLSYYGLVFFQLLLLCEILFVWLAIIGYIKSTRLKIPALFFYPYYFLLVNTYSLIGLWKAILGDIQITWSTPRKKDKQEEASIFNIEKLIVISVFILSVYLFLDIYILRLFNNL